MPTTGNRNKLSVPRAITIQYQLSDSGQKRDVKNGGTGSRLRALKVKRPPSKQVRECEFFAELLVCATFDLAGDASIVIHTALDEVQAFPLVVNAVRHDYYESCQRDAALQDEQANQHVPAVVAMLRQRNGSRQPLHDVVDRLVVPGTANVSEVVDFSVGGGDHPLIRQRQERTRFTEQADKRWPEIAKRHVKAVKLLKRQAAQLTKKASKKLRSNSAEV